MMAGIRWAASRCRPDREGPVGMAGAPGQSGWRPVTRQIVPPGMPRPVFAVLVYARLARARNRWFAYDRLAGAGAHALVIIMAVGAAIALTWSPTAQSGAGSAALFLAAISAASVSTVLASRHILKHHASRYALVASIILGAVAVGILAITLCANEKAIALMMLSGGIALADAMFAAALFAWALWPPVPHRHRWRV